MKRIPLLLVSLMILLAASAWMLLTNEPANGNGSAVGADELQTWNLHVQKRGNDTVWRVWDAGGVNRGHLRVRAGDQINWRAAGSPMDFEFTQNVDDYFTYDPGTFEDDSAHVNQNNWLRLTVKDNAPRDSLVYEVYIVNADTFAVGNSPPVLIVY